MSVSFGTHQILKKAAAVAIAAATVLSIAACGKDSKKNRDGSQDDDTVSIVPFDDDEEDVSVVSFDDTLPDETAATTTTTTAATAASTTKAAAKRDNSYKITPRQFANDDNTKSGSYPVISGLYDEEMQAFYNNLFKSDFENGINDSSIESGTMEYQVTLKSKDMLSIVFRCGVYMSGAAHPYAYAYAYTVDLATGETVIPSAAVDLDNAANALLTENGWTLTHANDGVGKSDVMEYFNQYSAETVKSYITESDVIKVRRSAKGKYTTGGTVSCRSYLDGSSDPVMILDVNHALGDYVEVQFD